MKCIGDVIVPFAISLLPNKQKSKAKLIFEIIDNWKMLVGSDIFKNSYPFAIFNNSSKRILKIIVNKAYGVQLMYMKNIIIQNINNYFGNEIINDIRAIECYEFNFCCRRWVT